MENPQEDRASGGGVCDDVPVDVRPDIHEILRRQGTSVEDIVAKLLPSLEAMRYDSDGDETDRPDWSARIKGGTLLMTALGYMKSSSVEVNVGISAEEREIEDAFKAYRQAPVG